MGGDFLVASRVNGNSGGSSQLSFDILKFDASDDSKMGWK
jgi:hypothetical protein